MEQHTLTAAFRRGSCSSWTCIDTEINPINRLGLHAKLLGFDHPVTRKHMVFTSPVPKRFRELFKKK